MQKSAQKIIVVLLLTLFLVFGAQAKLLVHYIDVGQGDAILIQTPQEKNILIDGGPRVAGDIVVNYLKEHNVATIDALIATHPHEDHIGGLLTVLDVLPIKAVYYPKIAHPTKTYENFLIKTNLSGAKRIQGRLGVEVGVDPSIKLIFLAPEDRNYEEVNHYSIVAKLTYGETSFLFTGDTEVINEEKMLENKANLQAEVLKVAHHGSRTSSSEAFLEAVDPDLAIISLGKDNSFGHPHQIVLDRLAQRDITVLRTDELGDIVLVSDGKSISIEPNDMMLVYVTPTGKKFHLVNCRMLRDNKIPLERKEALLKGYEPCEICKP